MATKPTDLPEWATTEEVDPINGQSNRVEPPSDKKDTGWDRRGIPPRQWLNWLLWVISKWVGWLDAGTASATASTVVERDASGRTQFADPSVAADAATKGYVDTGDASTLSSAQSYTDAAVDDLSGVTDAAGARTNLDVYSTGETDALVGDLSGVTDSPSARSNLGLKLYGFEISLLRKTGSSFSFASEVGSLIAVHFSMSGSRLYAVDSTTAVIYQYNLTTPYDLSTASYSGNSLDVTTQDNAPNSVELSLDGTRLFVAGRTSDAVYQYNLTTPYDLSTASYSGNSMDVSTEGLSPEGLAFSPSGDVFFVYTAGADVIYQYNLTTPYDLSTASYSGNSLDVTSTTASVDSISFDGSGSRLFVQNGSIVYEYTMGTMYDISTTVTTQVQSAIIPEISSPIGGRGITWSDDGKTMYVGYGVGDEAIHEFTSHFIGIDA